MEKTKTSRESETRTKQVLERKIGLHHPVWMRQLHRRVMHIGG